MGSDGHSSMLGGSASYDSQQGNSPDNSSGHIRNSERPELAKFPADLDFVSQQQFIRSQNIGVSPHTGQAPGFSDMKLLQQHLLYKRLQEFQRQQQLRQLDQGASQQSSYNQLSVAPKQAGINQLPALLNGVPINNISNYAQSNYFIGSESKTPSNPQMFFAGNANLTQGSGSSAPHFYYNGPVFRNDQIQAKQAMGIATQQSDSSLHGIPVLSTRGSLNPNPRFQGISPDCADMMSKAGANQVDKSLVQSAVVSSLQNVQGVKQQSRSQDYISVDEHRYQGKGFFENALVQSLNSNFTPVNLQSMDTLQQNVQQQKNQDWKEQADWSHDMHEKEVAQLVPSHGGASLDPTEEKILFGTGDDDTWGASFGSWSALVEDVVRGSSEVKGFDEEWNCFNSKTGDPITGKHSSVLNDNEKHPASVNNNMQNTPLLTSESFPLLNSSSNRHVAPSFLHSSTQFTYEQDGQELANASHESLQQSFEEAKKRQFDQSQMQKQFVDAGFQAQVHVNNVTNGHTHEQSMNVLHSSVSERNQGNKHSMWTHHQDLPMPFTRSQHSNMPNRWNANESMVHSGDGTLKFHDNQNIKHLKQGSETKKTMDGDRGYDGSMRNIAGNHVTLSGEEPKCDNNVNPHIQTEDTCMSKFPAVDNSSFLAKRNEMNQNAVSRHQVDGELAIFGSSVITKDGNVGECQRHGSMGPRASDSHPNYTVNGSCKTARSKQEHAKVVSNEDYAPYYSRRDEHTDNRDADRDNSFLISSQHRTLASVSEKSSRKIDGQNVANQGLNDHPVGNLRMNVDPANPQSHTSYSQGLSQSVIEGSANKEQLCIGDTQFVGRVVLNNALGMGKEQFSDFQRNKEVDDMQSRGTIPSEHLTHSFGGSTPHFSQNIMRGQTSQNMLELLQKVDQSRDSLARFGFPEQNMVSGIPKVSAMDGSSSPQHSQSSSGLRLGPPYQRQLFSNHALPSQTSINDFNAMQGSDTGKHQKRSTSASSVHSMATSREVSQRESSVHSMVTSPEVSQRESWINRSSGKPGKDNSNSDNQGNIIAVAASDPSHKDEKMQQNVADAPGYQVFDQSRRSFESNDQVIADQSNQASLPSMIGRIPPFRLPSGDNYSLASQFQPPNNGRPQPMDGRFYHVRNSSQQLPILDTSSFSQMPAASGMSRHAGYPTKFQNVWTSVSAQERFAGAQSHKFTPNKLDSMILSTNGRGTNSWALQKADDRIDKGGSPSVFGTCSTSSQQFTCSEEHQVKGNSSQETVIAKVVVTPTKEDSSLGLESVPKHHRAGNSPVSISSLVRQHQQDSSKGKNVLDISQNSQTEHVITSSSGGISLHGHAPKQSDGQLHNYSLLQQMQVMKGTDLDPRVGKRPKGPDSSSDTPNLDRESGPKLPFGQNSVFRYPVDDQEPMSSGNSFPSDAKMLSFSSRENGMASANPSSLLIGTEPSYRDKYSSWQHHIQNNTQSLGMRSKSNFTGGIKHSQISPQMAPSWFEQYGTCMNSQIPDTHDSQRIAKDGSQQDIFLRMPESIENSCVLDQRTSMDNGGSLRRSTSSTTKPAAESFFLPSDIVDHNIVPKSKKRKSTTSWLLPWHKVVTQASQRLQTISMVELDWAQATNRLIDKVEDGVEMIDGIMMPRAKRRLILTTQLMQQLLPSVPAAFLSEEATLAYECVTYFVAKAALVDACSMISYSKSDSHVHIDNENTISESLQKSEKAGGQVFVNSVEKLNERSRKLQTDLSRLEKRASLLDIRMECQELERFSIINRLGKFHGRGQTEGVGSSSTFGTAVRRTFPQRQITALSMPRNLPEGVFCLSL